MTLRLGLPIFLCLPVAAMADDWTCTGAGWALTLAADAAVFSFDGREIAFDIPHRATAEGAEWPRALTLIGVRDSAVVILEEPDAAGTVAIRVLTQRGLEPVLLTGYCE